MATKSTKGKTSTQRKLTAILCADVAGYSRLMGADEEATIETLTAYRKVFTSRIKKHRGSVVDAKGDAILAEFASVVDAVGSAVEIQRELAEKNAGLPNDRRMDFRIGINLGDVVVKDGVIYGDGVNIAARLESLAEPGGICISRPVHDQVKSKLKLEFEYLGEQQVKNIGEPVRAYQVRLASAAADPSEEVYAIAEVPQKLDKGSRIPSLVVLPFKNMSGDPEQDYFADGITEDLITALSNISRLSVVSRNTAFTYKGKAVNVKQVGKELDVDHVLEGSVRKLGNRVRITAQLIDTERDRHLWSERYDRTLEDIFDVQDEITNKIVTAMHVKLVEGEQANIWRRSTRNSEAYDLFLQSHYLWRSTMNREGNSQARALIEQAISLDPNFAEALVSLAFRYRMEAVQGWSENPELSIAKCAELVNQAIALDESLPTAHSLLGLTYWFKRDWTRALECGERAVSLSPRNADVMGYLAMIQISAGNLETAVRNIRGAMRLAPGYAPWMPFHLGIALTLQGDFAGAISHIQESAKRLPDSTWPFIYLAAAHAGLDQDSEAKAAASEVMRIEPAFKVEKWAPVGLIHKNRAHFDKIIGLVRKAGLPE